MPIEIIMLMPMVVMILIVKCDHDTTDKDEQVTGGDGDAVPRLQRA